MAAARGRRAARRDGRDRRAWVDRSRGRRARDGIRLPRRGGPATSGGGWGRRRATERG